MAYNNNNNDDDPLRMEENGNSIEMNAIRHLEELRQQEKQQQQQQSRKNVNQQNQQNQNQNQTVEVQVQQQQQQQRLYKSTRLKGYITLAVASFINLDSALNCRSTAGRNNFIRASYEEQGYAISVSTVSLIIVIIVIIIHLDYISPFHKIWLLSFQSKSRIELSLLLFFVLWWTIAVFIQTSVNGIAGDGKGQYSLYYSSWACCLTCYWMLEKWWVDAGWSSLKSFVSSWPNRAPAWMVIMALSFLNLIWFVDLRSSINKLDSKDENTIRAYFGAIPEGQWQLLLTVISVTLIPSIIFVFIELFRDSKEDGTIQSKSTIEIIIEGICFLVIVLLWVPTVLVATTPGGAASLIGNTYFFTWLLVVFVFEGVVWFIHDVRKEQHQALRRKEDEYRQRQQRVLDQSRAIQEAYYNKKFGRYNNNNTATGRNMEKDERHMATKIDTINNNNGNYTINDWDDSAMMKDNSNGEGIIEN